MVPFNRSCGATSPVWGRDRASKDGACLLPVRIGRSLVTAIKGMTGDSRIAGLFGAVLLAQAFQDSFEVTQASAGDRLGVRFELGDLD